MGAIPRRQPKDPGSRGRGWRESTRHSGTRPEPARPRRSVAVLAPPPRPEGFARTSGGDSAVASVMSWVRAEASVRNADEPGDVFDEEADETLLAQREWQSHMQRRVKEGYRDGVDAGKAVALQQGFNQGYKEGAGVIINYGQLRGTLSALLSWCRLHDNSSTLISKINNLLDIVGQCEEFVLKHLKSITAQPHVVDLLDSIEDMDLCHVVPAEKKIDEAKDERLCENNAELNKNCGKSPSGIDCSHLEDSRTEKHAHSEAPSLTWVLEQTASVVKQLGVPVDVLQHLRQL